jgi:hypothetical protein
MLTEWSVQHPWLTQQYMWSPPGRQFAAMRYGTMLAWKSGSRFRLVCPLARAEFDDSNMGAKELGARYEKPCLAVS